ncbi:MAG: helix-turn-helix transcriptional regulator [Chloroflexi bacterium]|nr:helix-turn-helix transcriptional regulator [Chloroflexota bacterium]
MPDSRSYETQRDCPVARTLDVVGDRWTILILRDLSWGRRRYSALLESLKGISTNLLADRLKKLEEADMIVAVQYSAHPPRSEYKLTAKGKAFVPILAAIRDYGEEWEPRADLAATQKR